MRKNKRTFRNRALIACIIFLLAVTYTPYLLDASSDGFFVHAAEPGEGEEPGTEDPGTEDPGTEDPGTEDPPGLLPAPTINWPTAAPITYGKSVGESTLTGGSTEYGSFQWGSADAGIYPPAGTYEYTVNFIPSAETQEKYEPIIQRTHGVSLTVSKAVPSGVDFPVTVPILESAGLSLRDVPFLDGVGDGTFAWEFPDFVPKAPGGLYNIVFTPNDPANFETVYGKAHLTVISQNEQSESHYDSTYTSDTLTIRIGVMGGKWKTLKVYRYSDVWNDFYVYDQPFTWIDNGGFLVLQAVRGVNLEDLLFAALAEDNATYDTLDALTDGDIQMIYFNTNDKGYYTNRSPASLFNDFQAYFPALPDGWNFEWNDYGGMDANSGVTSVKPMLGLEEYWHRVVPPSENDGKVGLSLGDMANTDYWRDINNYWNKVTSGARFRLAWGMPSSTAITGHDSAKYIDRIDLMVKASTVVEGGRFADYYSTFTEDQQPVRPGTPGGPDGPGGSGGSGGGTNDGDGGSGGSGTNNSENGGSSSGTSDTQGGTNKIVELTLADGTVVRALELDPSMFLQQAPDFNLSTLRGADLLKAQNLSLLELSGNGGGDGSDGKTVKIEDNGVPLVIPTDPRILTTVLLLLAIAFAAGGLSSFLKGRIRISEGVFYWISAQ
ncbi:MAG: hypothetical protein LBN36_08960 [Clostridiales Family XIII bacterium]|jgi:hypothetical protein|nr:hypothetical protein [Clostridiales Family XIII bacterium]